MVVWYTLLAPTGIPADVMAKLSLTLPFWSEALRDYNARRLVQFMDDMPSANADAPNLTLEQFNNLVHELRP